MQSTFDMAYQIAIGYSSNSLEFVEVDDDVSLIHSDMGSNPSVSSHSDWISSIFGPNMTSDSESDSVSRFG